MEWDDDDNESNENAVLQSITTDKSDTSKLNLRKSLIPHKKRVILQELEPISENNISDYHDHSSKSINISVRSRQKNMNPQCTSKKADPANNVAAPPETPPAALRQRIIEAQEMREYLDKELNELKEFTTYEKQVLAAEKGVESLQSRFDEVKNELEICKSEKGLISKELEEMKIKYVDEQTEKQILETKWKHREDDLKRSLEEAWSLLRIKEGRITKMNEKISFLYSEREKVKDLNITFAGQLLPTADECKIQTIEQNISELFELSCHNTLEHGRTSNFKYEIDCSGDNFQNSGLSEVNILQEELAKCRHTIETQIKQVEDLRKNLADKDFLISTYEKSLSELDNYVSDYLSDDLICVNKDTHTHKTSFERIKCDIKFFLTKYSANLEPKECGDTGFICPSELHSESIDIDKEKKREETVCQHSKTVKGLEEDKLKETCTLLLSDMATQTYEVDMSVVEDKLVSTSPSFSSNDQRKNEMDEITDVTFEEKDILLNKIKKFEEEIKNNDVEINILKAKLEEYEKGILKPIHFENSSQTIDLDLVNRNDGISNCTGDKSSDFSHKLEDKEETKDKQEEINILNHKISVYAEKLQSKEDEINKIQGDISDYAEKIKNKGELIESLQSKVTGCEETIKSNNEEIYKLRTNISDYEEKYNNKEEEIHLLQNKVVGQEEILNSYKDEINKLQSNISANENKDKEINQLHNEITCYKESIKNKEEEIIKLQGNILTNEDKIKNKDEEINLLQNKIRDCLESIKNKEDKINIFQNEITGYKESISNEKEEVSNLQNTILTIEDKIKDKDEEINMLQKKIIDYEESIQNKEAEISNLLSSDLTNADKIKNKDEEINLLQKKIIEYEENIKNKEDKINILENEITGYKESISNEKEEVSNLQSTILTIEDKIKNKDEEMNLLQKKIINYEESIQNKEAEISNLLSSDLTNADKIKNKDEEINLLQKKIIDYEESIKNKEDKINVLQNEITGYKESISKEKEEVSNLQNTILTIEDKIKDKDEEINMLRKKIIDYEESIKNKEAEISNLLSSDLTNADQIKNKDEEINLLQKKIIDYEENIKNKEDKINILQNEITGYKESISNEKEEVSNLQITILTIEDKIKNKDEEINLLQKKIIAYEESIKSKEVEISNLLSSDLTAADQIKDKDEEINMLRKKIIDYEESIKNKEAEISNLLSSDLSNADQIKNKDEEINLLQKKIIDYEENIKNKDDKINILQNEITGYKESISNEKEEVSNLQSTILTIEDKIKDKDEEINMLQNKIIAYEESIKNKEAEISNLLSRDLTNADQIKNKDEEINLLQKKIIEYEENIKNKEDKINILENEITGYKESISNEKEEVSNLQNTILTIEDKIKNKDEEMNLLQKKIIDYEGNIKNKEDNINILQNEITRCEGIIKGKEEEINNLQINTTAYEDTIKNKDEEMNLLLKKIIDYEESIKSKEAEISNLLCTDLTNTDQIKNKEEEMDLLQKKIIDYEESIKNKEAEISNLLSRDVTNADEIKNKDEEINLLQNKIICYEENIKNKEDKIDILQNQIAQCEESIKYKEDKINILQNEITGYEESIKNKNEEINNLQLSTTAFEDIIKNKDEEIGLLQNKITCYEESIKNKEDKIDILQNQIAQCEESIKNKEDKINILQNEITGCEESIKNKNEEINNLQVSTTAFEEIIKNKDVEMNFLQHKIIGYEESIKNKDVEIDILQNQITGCEESIINNLQSSTTAFENKIKNKDEEINLLQNKITDYKECIKNREEEIGVLQNQVTDYKEGIINKDEEIIKLHNRILTNADAIKNKDKEIIMLRNKVIEHEDVLNCYKDEINKLHIKASAHEDTIKLKDKEINKLQNEITCYEEGMKNKEEEIIKLQDSILINEDKIKNKDEEINLLQNKITGCKEAIKNDEAEITRLQIIISDYNNKYKMKEEEILLLQSTIIDLEEIIDRYKGENNILLNKISGYEVKIQCNGDEINNLLGTISACEDEIKNKGEEINMLQSKVLEYEYKIKNNEEKIKQNKDERNSEHLEKNVVDLKETIKNNVDAINILHAKVSDYEEKINRNEGEIISLKNEISFYKDEIAHYEEELNNKVLFYEKTVKSYADEVNRLKHDISKNELLISERLQHFNTVSESAKNIDDLNSTVCSSVPGNISVAYSHNDFADIEYENTLNFTTLNSRSQLEQSVFISELPQTDNSILEYDPLASVAELSYSNKELETTLTEQFIKPCRFDEDNPINSDFNEKIKALICLFNNEGDLSDANISEISKQLLAVKEVLRPKEDYVIYSFCHIIENLLKKQFVKTKIWNEKMLVVKDTLSNVQNIRDSFLELKHCFSSLENTTSQNHETINSHFKNLFLCNRELSTENILLKEQLKVSLLSEEKLTKINELMKTDLNNTLQTEKELKKMKEDNKHLEDELKEKCKKEGDIILVIDKMASLLNPNLSWPTDKMSKMEQMYSLLMESICQVECEDLHSIGYLQFIRNLVTKNSVLKKKIDTNIKVIKDDLTALNLDITHQFENLNIDFHFVTCKLSELYEKQEQDCSVNNILRDNVKNLVSENKNLKVELHNLKILNSDLSSTSKDYSDLMDKYKNLNNIIREKDDLLSDHVKFQEQVYFFVDSLKDLYFMKDFEKLNNSFSFSDKSNYIDFLVWLKGFLNEVHSTHKFLHQNVKSYHHFNLSEVISELVKEKNDMSDAYCSLNSEFHNVKQSLMLFPENIGNIKNALNAISSDVMKSKFCFIQDLISIKKSMEALLLSCHQRDVEYDSYKSDSKKSYNELNEKYLELQCSYENIEIELKSSDTLIKGLNEENDKLRREATEHEVKCNELRELISNYEMELLDYKNIYNSLKKKIIDVEKEKEKIEEDFLQICSLKEHNNLETDKNKVTEIIHNIKKNNSTIKDSCKNLISCDIKNLADDFIHLKNIIYTLLEVRNKYTTLELSYPALMSDRNELLSKIESLNNLVKENVDKQTSMINEIQVLKEKNSEQTDSFYSKKVIELLKLLDYDGPSKIDDLAWAFIEETICKYKLVANQNTDCDKLKLEEKILFLESQLCDAQDFKSKFSKELHMLKPDLDISYLMSLSLADLQKTMIIAIIEKEKDVIEDYEMKLALNTDRIQQLEEQQKRREDWLQEIEKENERLANECKQIQNENESLKTDVNLKLHKIIDLEHQITQQINGERIKEYIKEREDSNNQLETAANEKHTLQLSIASLNEKLQNKSLECEEVYNSLQKKAEVIFGLEKVLSKCKTENANLEKEVQHLRESMVLNLNNFNDNKQALEKDLADYKDQIKKLHQLLSDTQKEVQTENKSVSVDLDENVETELQIEDSLINHLAKIESLNLKIDYLNSQLKLQNNKFDEEFENQAKFIESLERELTVANELNTVLKNNISDHNQKDVSPHLTSIEVLEAEINTLREVNNSLETEKALLLKEKQVLEQSKILHKEEEFLVNSMKKEIDSVKIKLNEEEAKNITKQEQIDNLLLKLESFAKELTSAQNTIEELLKQNLVNKQLKEEVNSLISELENCKMQICTLIKEKEIKDHQLSEYLSNLNLEKEISCSLKSTLEQTHQELANLKSENILLTEKYSNDLQLQIDTCSKLNSDICQMKEIITLQENELSFLRNELKEKVTYLEEISSSCHLEKSCPFMKEAEDIKTKHYDLNKQLEQERETFKSWKTNLEEDRHCKLQKISDLELKLKKETQLYKEALMSNSELHQKLQESVEKFKRLEDKMAIQRDVFIKEKNKSDIDLQNKEKLQIELEEKLLSVKNNCEEFSKDICMFLEKLSVMLKVDVIDLSSAIILINDLTIEKQIVVKELKKTQEKAEQSEKELKEAKEKAEFFEKELKQAQEMMEKLEEELKEAQEKAEQLEEECEELNNDIKYHENEIGNLYKNGKLKEEMWLKEKEELEKTLLLQIHELREKNCSQEKVILSLHLKIEKFDKTLISCNAEKKILESEKLELERKIIDLEKNLQSLKNQEISYLDGIKHEMNHLKLELVNKNKAISKLEMRLASDTLPFQKKAELAERKVDELTKELRILKQSQSLKQMSSVLTSPMAAGLEVSPSHKDKIIERLEQEVKQLITEKSALKLLAQNRRAQINELKEQLGKKDVNSFQD